MQLEGNIVLAKRLDRFRQIQFAPVDGEAFGRKQLRDVHEP